MLDSEEARLRWLHTPDLSIHVLLDGNYRVGVVAPALYTPHHLEGDWTWVLLDDPDIEWGAEGSLQTAMHAAQEAYLNLLDFTNEWLPENTLHIRTFAVEER